MEFAADPLYQIGEDYVLFLKYNVYGQLHVVGVSQGRFRIVEEQGSERIINELDLYVQETMAERLNQKKDFSVASTEFITTAKQQIAKQQVTK